MQIPIETRDQLILEHLDQVDLIASKYAKRTPAGFDELVSVGIMGLMKAVETFDPARGLKLCTLAERRINGAILDYLRKCDWCSRHRRRKAKLIDQARIRAANTQLAEPDDTEVAAELGVPLEEFRRLQKDTANLDLQSLDAMNHWEFKKLVDRLADDEPSPLDSVEAKKLLALVRDALTRLPARERRVVDLYFEQDLPLREIATRMRIHITSVAHLKASALRRMRDNLVRVWPSRGEGIAGVRAA